MKLFKSATSLLIILSTLSCSKNEDVVLSKLSITATENITEPDTGEFVFEITNPLPTSIKINYEISGSATNGVDYESIPNTLSIPANQSMINLPINSFADKIDEGDEDIIITIVWVSNDAISFEQQSSAILTIKDSPPTPLLNPEDTRSFIVNPNATNETVALFYNLKVLSTTHFVVGQQDAFNSFFNNASGESDMKKTTGSDPGLLGSDFMFITDDENDESSSNWFYQQEQTIKADVIEAYNKGMINIFSWHLREPYEGEEFYTSNMTNFQKANAFKSILPGGENHEYYKLKLDKLAKVTLSMVGADGQLVSIIFRPFHEFDGDWFWWGKSYCSPEEYISLWQFTVEYLRDVKNVNNMLFAYSPHKNFESAEVYLERYPGDDYVDILGMDNYGNYNEGTMGIERANSKLKIISDLASERTKIAALTESCFFVTPGENNFIPKFYSENLYTSLTKNNVQLGFMMFWNNTKDTFCVPPPAQEGASDFIEFANKPKSLLAKDLPGLYSLPSS